MEEFFSFFGLMLCFLFRNYIIIYLITRIIWICLMWVKFANINFLLVKISFRWGLDFCLYLVSEMTTLTRSCTGEGVFFSVDLWEMEFYIVLGTQFLVTTNGHKEKISLFNNKLWNKNKSHILKNAYFLLKLALKSVPSCRQWVLSRIKNIV